MDLAENRYYFDSQQMNEDLEIYKKTFLIPAYKVVSFEEFHGDTFQDKEADKHSWTIRCKTKTGSSVYDKAYELAARHGVDIDDKILRLELRLERKRFSRVSPASSPFSRRRRPICDFVVSVIHFTSYHNNPYLHGLVINP